MRLSRLMKPKGCKNQMVQEIAVDVSQRSKIKVAVTNGATESLVQLNSATDRLNQ